jgi:CheY-like chemotaxis protein
VAIDRRGPGKRTGCASSHGLRPDENRLALAGSSSDGEGLAHRRPDDLHSECAPRLLDARANLALMQILLVDDEDDARSLLARVLRRQGYSVDTCADAPLALIQLEATSYDVMITDQVMPGMSGTDLVLAARRLQRGLRCIVASGHGPPEESSRGDTAWITKPLDLDAVLSLLGPP